LLVWFWNKDRKINFQNEIESYFLRFEMLNWLDFLIIPKY
jgi:hypothetical protein